MKKSEPKTKVEVEVKFLLQDPAAFRQRVLGLGAVCTQERIFEQNLRFDTADGRLRAAREVLRLRQDSIARLTFKGPADPTQSVAVRPEIEFSVGDFHQARLFLEALGFQVSVIYEKYRASYELDGAEISVDEMPFGTFCEIEGNNASQIQGLASRLALHWQERITESYLALFESLKTRRELTMHDLTFEAFQGIRVSPADFLPPQEKATER